MKILLKNEEEFKSYLKNIIHPVFKDTPCKSYPVIIVESEYETRNEIWTNLYFVYLNDFNLNP